MDNDLFHLFGKSSKKIFFLYKLDSRKFDYLSEAVERIWQVERELILEKPRLLIPHIHPDDKKAVFSRFKEIVEEGVAHDVEISLVLPDGSRKEVRIEAYPIYDEAGSRTHIAGEAGDVTKQSDYVDYLREFGRRKNSALEIIAHDLRGPLAIVKSVAALLESDHQEQKYEEIGTYTNIITSAYNNCLSIISDVLKDEHLKSPTIHLNTQRFEIVGAMQSLLHSYQVAKGVDYIFDLVAEEEKIMVELDEVKLMQVFNNLVSNSIKFTKQGGKITIELKRENYQLLIKHSDNGVGIPRDLLPHVFERYGKASRPGLRGEPSIGVGMAIVRELVEVQGGKIWVESEESQGTTFYVRFPLPDE